MKFLLVFLCCFSLFCCGKNENKNAKNFDTKETSMTLLSQDHDLLTTHGKCEIKRIELITSSKQRKYHISRYIDEICVDDVLNQAECQKIEVPLSQPSLSDGYVLEGRSMQSETRIFYPNAFCKR